MIKADLHLHTRYSDGYNTVAEMVQMAKDAKLTHIALTDHDNLVGWEEKYDLATKAGLKIVKSVEISAECSETGKIVHMLGYNIKDNYPIEKICNPIKKARNDKAFMQVQELQKLGYDIQYEKLYDFAMGHIFKQHIFDMLYRTNQVEAIFPQINDTLFMKGGRLFFDIDYADAIEAVKAIKDAGGYAVLAHPNQQDNISLVDKLVKYGLNGIELNHESNSVEYKKIIREYAKKYNLFLTGGSDYHGAYTRRIEEVGSYLSEENGYVIFE